MLAMHPAGWLVSAEQLEGEEDDARTHLCLCVHLDTLLWLLLTL